MKDKSEILEFGIKRDNEERRDGGCGVVFNPKTQKYAVGKNISDGKFRLFAGGVDPDEDIEKGVLREVIEESGLHDFLYVEKITEVMAHYYNHSRNVNRVTKSTCFLVVLNSDKLVDVQHEEHEKFDLHWATAEEILSNWKENNINNDYDHLFHFFSKAIPRAKELGYDTTSVI